MNNQILISLRSPLAKLLIFLVLFFSYVIIGQFTNSSNKTMLVLEITSGERDTLQVFWKKRNQDYSEERSTRTTLKPSQNIYRIVLPEYARYNTLRIDPLTRPGNFVIRSLVLQVGNREILETSDYNTLQNYIIYESDIAIKQSSGGWALITSAGIDPQLELQVKSLRLFVKGNQRIIGISFFLSLLTIVLLYWLFSNNYRKRAHSSYPKTKVQWSGWGLGVFLCATYIIFTYPVEPLPTLGYPALIIILASWFFILIFFLATRPLAVSLRAKPGRFAWFFYSIPALLVFSVYLLSFWPASMSPDSLDQWKQVITFDFKDWHPVFHTLTLWLVTRLWETPLMASVFQICIMACSFGWALSRLQILGVPRFILLCTVVFFAFLPVNGLMAITIWKDIPYSVSMMILSVILLEISITSGEWLDSKKRILIFSIILLFVSLYRHNGILPAFATPIILLILYSYQWKKIVILFSIVLALHMIIRGPLYDRLDVNKGNPLDHVVAKIEKKIRGLFQDYDGQMKSRDSDQQTPGKTSLSTVLSQKIQSGILVRLQSASLLWRVRPLEGYYHRVDYVNVWGQKKDEGLRIRYLSGNKLGLHESQIVPRVTDKLYHLFEQSKYHPFLFWMWRPAVFLYLLIAGALVASLRNRKNLFLPLVPLLLNSAPTLLFVIHKSIFRYHYSIILTSILLTLPLFTTYFRNRSQQNIYR